MATTMHPTPITHDDLHTIVVPDHPGSLVEAQESPAPEPTRDERRPDLTPWVVGAIAVAAWLIGFVLGIIAGAPAPEPVFVGWAPVEYGLMHEHLAQAPANTGYGLMNEHLAQAPDTASYGLAREHLALAR